MAAAMNFVRTLRTLVSRELLGGNRRLGYSWRHPAAPTTVRVIASGMTNPALVPRLTWAITSDEPRPTPARRHR